MFIPTNIAHRIPRGVSPAKPGTPPETSSFDRAPLAPYSYAVGSVYSLAARGGLQIRDTAQRGQAATKGARLWSKTQPQSVALGMTGVLRLVLRTAPHTAALRKICAARDDSDRH